MKITRVLAPNPGLFTGRGTNSWVVASAGKAAVIDPGPSKADHRREILEALGRLEPVVVLVTHCHPDHVALANPLASELEVPAWGCCPGPGFKPDRLLADGDVVEVGEERLEVIGTPGHTAHHLCYRADGALFAGDHIMGGSSVIVEYMAEYLESLEKLRGIGLTMLYPGHGEPMDDPDEVIGWYIAHRLEREAQIVTALREGRRTVGRIVEECYQDVDPAFHLMAARSVSAHLRKLCLEGVVALPMGSADWSSPVVYPAPATGSDC